MLERLLILLWLPVVGIFAYFKLIPLLVIIIWLVSLWEIYARLPLNTWGYIAIVHVTCFLSILCLGSKEALLLITVVILNDTFAYIGGKFFNFLPFLQKTLFPKTSPKKTYGGLLYGVIFSLAGGMICATLLGIGISPATILLISLLAVMGDYIESKFKRKAGIKDSGEGLFTQKLFRGHGGIYDRFDAISLAALGMALLNIK